MNGFHYLAIVGVVGLVLLFLAAWLDSEVLALLSLGPICGSVLFIVIGTGLHLECESKAEGLDRDWRWGYVRQCQVESDDGTFVPIDNLRIVVNEGD